MLHENPSADRSYLRLVARCLWRPDLRHRHDPSDFAQRTLARAAEKVGQFRGTTFEEWRGWLRMILINELNQEGRRRVPGERRLEESSRCLEEAIAAEQTSPSQAAIRGDELERLAQALDRLPEDERTAVELRHLHGCSVPFISDFMGRTVFAVEGLLKRGRHRLRQMLEGSP